MIHIASAKASLTAFLSRILAWLYACLPWITPTGRGPNEKRKSASKSRRKKGDKATQSRPTGSSSSSDEDIENIEDVEAKAIAESLVTRATTTDAETPQSSTHRRSMRILRLRGEEGKRDTLKSPMAVALSPEIAHRAKRRAAISTLVPARPSRKTLILDLDETLIHSLSKGGKMSNGHMVEVKLGTHAILYYVHKRPFCDMFLDAVSQWYDVVVFTASVQEYADPVIDWLEQDRKYFKARYYRQHCTFRYGAYMKDLCVAQKDLSKAIIVDNSPLSYRLNEENAIPIEGWISDPSDRDLLYLIPVLQSLYLVHDVRSLLALRCST